MLKKAYDTALTKQQRLALSTPKYQAIMEAMSIGMTKGKDILKYAQRIVPETEIGSVMRVKSLFADIEHPKNRSARKKMKKV